MWVSSQLNSTLLDGLIPMRSASALGIVSCNLLLTVPVVGIFKRLIGYKRIMAPSILLFRNSRCIDLGSLLAVIDDLHCVRTPQFASECSEDGLFLVERTVDDVKVDAMAVIPVEDFPCGLLD